MLNPSTLQIRAYGATHSYLFLIRNVKVFFLIDFLSTKYEYRTIVDLKIIQWVQNPQMFAWFYCTV